MINAAPPHKGRVTYHHDQSITLHSFKIMKARPSNPQNPMPPLDEDFFDILLSFKLIIQKLNNISGIANQKIIAVEDKGSFASVLCPLMLGL